MSVLRICAKYAIITSDHPVSAEVVIEFTKLLGQKIRESIFKAKKEYLKFIK